MLAESVEATPYEKLSAALQKVSVVISNFVTDTLKVGDIAEYIAENMISLTGAIGLFVSTISRSMLPFLYEGPTKAAEAAEQASAAAKKASEEALLSGRNLGQSVSKLPKVYSDLLPSIQAGTASVKDQEKAIKS